VPASGSAGKLPIPIPRIAAAHGRAERWLRQQSKGRRRFHCATNGPRRSQPVTAGSRRLNSAGRTGRVHGRLPPAGRGARSVIGVSGFFRGSEAFRWLLWKGAPRVFSPVTEHENCRITRMNSMEPKHAKVLTPAKFRHLLRVTEATSRFPERDTLILLLGVTCGMRVTEIARVEVGHMLSRRGARQEEIALPGRVTKGCRPRCSASILVLPL